MSSNRLTLYRLFFDGILLVVLGLCLPRAAWATVQKYNLPTCYVNASNMTATVGGVLLDTRAYEPYANKSIVAYYYAHCGVSGTNFSVTVDATKDFTTCTVSPKNYNITATRVAGTFKVTFTLPKAEYVEVKFDNRPTFYILADPIETNVPTDHTFDVHTAYGADNTGATDVTTNINNAVTAAHNHAGGGTVFVPAGIYLSRTINLQSSVHIYLAPGAVLYANPDHNLWGAPNSSNHFINANNRTDVEVYGRGTIDCRGCLLANYVNPSEQPPNTVIQLNPIQTLNTSNIQVYGVILNESTAWTLQCRQSSSVTVTNVKVLNPKPDLDGQKWEWNDGIDMVGTHDAAVSHCFISTVDDAACAKSLTGYPTYNVTYDDIVADSGHANGFKVGSETGADIYNVTCSNFNVIYCHRGFDLIHWGGIGSWHDIHFVDWRVEKVGDTTANGAPSVRGTYYQSPIRMEIFDKDSNGLGPISNVEVTRVTFDAPGPTVSYLWGDSATNTKVSNVCFTNLKINGSLISNWGTYLVNEFFTNNITWNVSSTPVTFEGESLPPTTFGCTTAIDSDARYSNGQALRIDAVGVGNYVEVTLPNVPAGTYKVQIYYKSLNNRGQYQATLDGVAQGGVQDQYGLTEVFGLANDLGAKTWYTTGNKVLRMTVIGKNAGSAGYKLMIDKVVLTPGAS